MGSTCPWGAVSRSARAPGTDTYWDHRDGLGSVVDITDGSGTSVSWSEYFSSGSVRLGGDTVGVFQDVWRLLQHSDGPLLTWSVAKQAWGK